VRPGDRVLEVGAGPGRFTIELARLGARITVTDISPVQLELNAHHVREAGCGDAVERRLVQDVREVSRFGNGKFDVIVAFGGPLSYVFDDAEDVFRQLVFVVRPAGVLLASVMSTVGSFRYFLPQALTEAETYGAELYDHVMATGDLRAIPGSHTCQMYRWREIEALAAGAPGRFVAASASNCMSLGDADVVAQIEADPDRWAWFLDWEERMCRESGAVDGGTHTLFAFRRDPGGPGHAVGAAGTG
jgi:SAM-dependent methyltransferase